MSNLSSPIRPDFKVTDNVFSSMKLIICSKDRVTSLRMLDTFSVETKLSTTQFHINFLEEMENENFGSYYVST